MYAGVIETMALVMGSVVSSTVMRSAIVVERANVSRKCANTRPVTEIV